ncbi:hypothetical protein [Legionella massiliensis]|nr:hypothetical protein [Legionella massiliensis]
MEQINSLSNLGHDKFELPTSLMQNLKLVSPPLALAINDFYQEKNLVDLCCIELYTQLVSTIEDGFATIFDIKKAELLKELISIDGRKNFIKNFQNEKNYSLLVSDAIAHSKPEYEEEIKLKLQELDQLIASMKRK